VEPDAVSGHDAIAFSKYHALGNDYLVIDGRENAGPRLPEITRSWARRVCDRHLGIGGDGILLAGSDPESGLFSVRIFNPDGSEAEKSGNGLRIFARYLWDRGEVELLSFPVRTQGGTVSCRVLDGGRAVSVEMGRISFDSREIPVAGERREVLRETLEIDGRELEYSAASIGNPHCVLFRDSLDEAEILSLGPQIEREPRFPKRTNVQLAQVIDRSTLRIEIWERGAGHTLASGSSGCAAAGVAHRLGLCDARVRVEMRGGSLSVEIGEDFSVVQTGPVVRVAEGTLCAEGLAALCPG
jgi:diaminopimelate epimerase